MNQCNVFITGVSSGIGLETFLLLAKSNCFVIGSVRDQPKKEQIVQRAREEHISHMVDVIIMDITEHEQVINTVDQVVEKYGKIDILINNAGYCLGGFTEEVSLEEWQAQFDTNVFGTIGVTKAFLPHFRKQENGRIIVLSSIIGRIGLPSMAPYASSKFALKGFADSLRLELLHTGIDVTVVEPGAYQTKIWDKGLESLREDGNELYKRERKAIGLLAEKAFQSGKRPHVVAEALLAICQKKYIKKQYVIGWKMKGLLLLFRVLPSVLIESYLKTAYKRNDQSL